MRVLLPFLFLLGACSHNLAPHIVRINETGMQAVVCPQTPGGCPEVQAAYDHKTQTIYLPADWSADSEYDLSTLLHEFIHHIQWLAGDFDAECMATLEGHAYKAQIAFLIARGDPDPHKTIGMDAFTLAGITNCWN